MDKNKFLTLIVNREGAIVKCQSSIVNFYTAIIHFSLAKQN